MLRRKVNLLGIDLAALSINMKNPWAWQSEYLWHQKFLWWPTKVEGRYMWLCTVWRTRKNMIEWEYKQFIE